MNQPFHIEWPPSSNAIWRAWKGRNITSAKYREWKKTAGAALEAQHVEPIIGPVEIEIDLCSPTKRAFDIDNRAKPILDLLVSHGVIESDDNRTVKSLALFAHDQGFVGAHVTIKSASPRVEITDVGIAALGEDTA